MAFVGDSQSNYTTSCLLVIAILSTVAAVTMTPSQFTSVAVFGSAVAWAIKTTKPPNPHKVKSLPHYNDAKPINFDQYAGHIPLPSNGQKMFYWLVESESNPSTDPLVLWLNGGPGCSSLGGFFTELGPFVVQSDLSVKRNPYAWNRKANMVFLDSPAGVGFSQPLLNASDYTDDFTAGRLVEFLKQFLVLYPQYKNRDFYITGESYAGMYIPFLVHKLITDPVENLHLTGFAIGNPFTDTVIDGTFNTLQSCNLLDRSDVYGDVCLLTQVTSLRSSMPQQLTSANPRRRSSAKLVRPLTHRGVIGPCQALYTAQYLQLYAVQRALHVYDMHVNWVSCNPRVTSRYTRTRSALPKYPTILQAGLKALVYSGDADATVPFLGTQRWLTTPNMDNNVSDGLDLSIVSPWQSWVGPDKQLAGYTVRYTNLTFTTVKGAGHMVPATRPLHALYLFECFVYSQVACDSFAYPKDSLEYLSGADISVGFDGGRGEGALIPWAITAVVVVLGSMLGLVFWAKKEPDQVVEYS
ncbi:hypothetical protein DYB25_009342, partial [Aphanomyces astaci]